ncbi:MAG TPA: molybdate ABC transporter substrate-binding protein [Tissierellaceae bacterium]
MQWKKDLILAIVLIILIINLISCNINITDISDKNNDKIELLIAGAASLMDVLQEIGELYETKNPNIKLNFTFSGSGALQAQIEEGAPVDVFFSASQKQMNTLKEKGYIIESSIKTLLINKIVLIAPKNSKISIYSFNDLAKDNVDKIAVGDPYSVPVGQYSEEIFNNLGLYNKIKSKLVFGNDVRTVLAWVENGEVPCGIVYKTDALISDKVDLITEAPEGSHTEIIYPVGIVKDCKNIDKAQEFIDFLSSHEAISIFKKYGFDIDIKN